MTTYIIILICIIACYFILNLIMHMVPEVEAGPTSGIKTTGHRHVSGKVPISYKKKEDNGTIAIHRKFVVKGKCMEPKGIEEGSIVDVRILNSIERSSIKDQLKKDSIVLIYLNDDNFRGYKLRIIDEIRQNDVLTYYYKNNNKNNSSKPHSFKDIIGIVEG